MFRIGIVTDKVGWHSQAIADALGKRGCSVFFSSLNHYEFVNTADWYPSQHRAQASLSECQAQQATLPFVSTSDQISQTILPDAVFVRCIPYGSFEQVTFYLTVLHALQAQSVLVYNNARMIERTVDKMMTSFLLQQAGVPTPPTWAGLGHKRALALLTQQLEAGHAVVVKPVFGAQGQGLQYCDANTAMPHLDVDAVFYLQQFIPSANPEKDKAVYCDWRLFVINGKTVAAMKRIGTSWMSNVAQGARCQAARPVQSMSQLAEKAVQAIGIYYAGVDLIVDKAGKPWVIEVNSIPAWQGLQSVVEVNIAEQLADDLLVRLQSAKPPQPSDAS